MAVLPFHTPFVPILDAIVNQLATWPPITSQGITEDDVLEVASDEAAIPYTRPDAEILVRAGDLMWVESRGPARVERRVKRRLIVTVRTRLNVDEPDRAHWWLSDPNLGYVAVEEAVLDALDVYSPLSLVDGVTQLVYEPMKWIVAGTPTRRQGDGWGSNSLFFAVPYILNYTRIAVEE